MVKRPVFQHQGPKTNCVIDDQLLGWKSCTAYAMAMLIDGATDGAQRPKGCRVRRLVNPKDVVKGLTLGQVAAVAEETFGVPIAIRTGANVITVEAAVRQIRLGRGFVLQGNNTAWGMGDVNHAVYVHEVRGGTEAEPAEGLLYDPQRQHERWMAWPRILAFGAALRLDSGRVLGPGLLFAGFAPRPMTQQERETRGAVKAGDGVELMFGARKLPRPDRTVAHAARGRMVNVRSTPRSLSKATVVGHLARGTVFIAFQRVRGVQPPGAASAVWFGNKDGTEWIHVSGLRGIKRRDDSPINEAFEPPDEAFDPADEPPILDPDDPDGDPADPGTTDSEEEDPGRGTMPADVLNDDLSSVRAGADAPAPTSDPDPAAEDASFPGRPLTDDEIDALPPDDDDDTPD